MAIEDRFIDAFDEKYHRDEWRKILIEQEESCLNENPRKNWLTNGEKADNIEGE